MKILISPHNDDETLFAGMILARVKPELVLFVYDSYLQKYRGAADCDVKTRREESRAAVHELSPSSTCIFVGLDDATRLLESSAICGAMFSAIARSLCGTPTPTEVQPEIWDAVIEPVCVDDGHAQHNAVGLACSSFFATRRRIRYTTYTRVDGRDRAGEEFAPTTDEIVRKHRALACYVSQIGHPSTRSWFTSDIAEYTQEGL